jgi:hypothetical protein
MVGVLGVYRTRAKVGKGGSGGGKALSHPRSVLGGVSGVCVYMCVSSV